MNNQSLYKKIMNHINKRTNCSTWDWRTLNISYPHLAQQIFILLQDHYKNNYDKYDSVDMYWFFKNGGIKNSYIPQNIF